MVEKVTLSEATGFGTQLKLRFSDLSLTPISNQNWSSLEKVGDRGTLAKISSPDVSVQRSLSLDDDGYGGRVEYNIRFLKDPPKFVFLDLLGSPKRQNDQEGSIFGQAPDKVHVT